MITPRIAQDFMDKYLWILVLVLAVAIFWKEILRGIRRFVERVRTKGLRQALKRERKPLDMTGTKEGKDDADKIQG